MQKVIRLLILLLSVASTALAQTTKINPATLIKPGGNSTFLLTDGSGNVTFANAATLLTTGTGISISGNNFTLDAELVGLAGLTGTGFPAMTGAGAFSNRSLAIGTDASGLTGTWTNPAGVAGNPTLAIETGALAWKRAVRVATTANITLSGNQTIDGVSTSTGDRVLVKNQTTATENGVYASAAGAWARVGDADAAAEFEGQVFYVREGTANANKMFSLTTTGSITLGSTNLAYTQYPASTAPTLSIQRFEDVPGSNTTTTTVSGFTPSTTDTMVFLDGVQMDWGAGEDITVSGSVITFNFTVLAGQKIVVKKFIVS